MFQSDEFDCILTDEHFETIDRDIVCSGVGTSNKTEFTERKSNILIDKLQGNQNKSPPKPKTSLNIRHLENEFEGRTETPNRVRRKRKFPGPAGLLPDSLPEKVADNLGNVIQSSQNYNCSQNQLPSGIFDEAPWLAMQSDIRTNNIHVQYLSRYTIARVKVQALAHRLEGRKVPLLSGVVQSIDRTLQDPLIVLQDATAEIQCTLHRDAWELLGPYLVPQYSVMLLKNTTVLTTGSALKKIYLNITINNILSIYSDEENNYSKNGNLFRCSGDTIPKNFTLETIEIGMDKVTILKNTTIQHLRDQSGVNLRNDQNNSHEPSDEHDLAQTLLEGIDTDLLLEDFDT